MPLEKQKLLVEKRLRDPRNDMIDLQKAQS